MKGETQRQESPLGSEKLGILIRKYSIPAIIATLVSALYNIADQIFIGKSIGILGNAATNISFPLITMCTAIALLIGVGGSTNFNLSLGAKNTDRAKYMMGNSIIILAVSGIIFSLIVIIFLDKFLYAFGATEKIFELAKIYTGITAIGFPFLIFTTGASPLIRADGSPMYSMISVLIGAVLNVILDPLLIFTFDMGIAGAAIATVISQVVSFIMVVYYIRKFKTVHIERKNLKVQRKYIKPIISLGAAASLNQIAMTVLQIALNNTLRHYGSLSDYGSEIPIAVVGIISKVNVILIAFTLGISQGCQPIFSFNYGAKNYDRVKKTFKIAAILITSISIFFELIFQIFPRQIISIFGEGNEMYFAFGEKYFRIFMLMTFINGFLPLTGNFFTAIGKARLGVLTSLTRQIVFLIPLIIIFPIFMGIDGVMYAGPIADSAAAILLFFLMKREFKKMSKKEIQI